MKQIEVFYHLFIVPDWKGSMWVMYVDSYVEKLRKSRLLEVANVNICITMAKHLTQLGKFQILKDRNSTDIITYGDKVKEYINTRYPFINVLDIRDVSEPNIFEGQTLQFLHKRAQEVDAYFLYMHSKGMSNFSPVGITANWKEVLEHFMIEKWTYNVNKLSEVDLIGVRDLISNDVTMSGNHWWSKSSYIKTLQDPVRSDLYMASTEPHVWMHPNGPNYRFAFERWIMSNNPKYHYIVDTKTDHYLHYCFVEDLIKGWKPT